MSVYEWPLSPIYEIPISPCRPSFAISSVSPAHTSHPASRLEYVDGQLRQQPSRIQQRFGNLMPTPISLSDLFRGETYRDTPQITTKPKHRLNRFKKSTTIIRLIPLLSIILIILTFTYLTLRDPPFTVHGDLTYLKRSGAVYEITTEGVPTGFGE